MSKYKVLKVISTDIFDKLHQTKKGYKFYHIDEIKFMYFPQKIKTFAKNCRCIACGIEGTEVRIEYMKNCGNHLYGKPHLNFYAKCGMYEVLMTVDHDKLASKGGDNSEDNYNTMCTRCNQLRGSKYETVELFLESVKGRDLLNEHMIKYFTPKESKPTKSEEYISKSKRNNEYWEDDHISHYRDYLRHLRKLAQAKKYLGKLSKKGLS